MKATKDHEYEIGLSVRTESGRCSIDLSLDDLSIQERQFIFNSVASTLKGGFSGFGMRTEEDNGIVIEIILSGPNLKKPILKAVKSSIN